MTFDVTIDEYPNPGYDSVDYNVDYTVTNNGSSSTDQDIELHVGPLPSSISEIWGSDSLSDYSGQTGGFSTKESNGAQKGWILEGSSGYDVISTYDRGIWEPGMNVRFRVHIGDETSDELAFLVAMQDEQNDYSNTPCYSLMINAFLDEWGLYDEPRGDTIVNANYTFENGHVYEAVMKTYDNNPTDFDLTLYDITDGVQLDTLSVTDDRFSHHNTGITGWMGWMNPGCYIDLAEEVSESYEPELMVIWEDFESGDLSNWRGETGQFNISSSYQYEGTYSVEAPANSGGSDIMQYDATASESPGSNGPISQWVRINGDEAHKVYFYLQDSTTTKLSEASGYALTIRTQSDVPKLQIWSNGSVDSEIHLNDQQQNVVMNNNEWYRFDVFPQTEEGPFTTSELGVEIYDSSGSLWNYGSTTNYPYSSGYYGILNDHDRSAPMYVDYITDQTNQ